MIRSGFVKNANARSPVNPSGGNRVIKIKVPELLKKKGWNATDLMRKANIAYATALRLSKAEGEAISFEVLQSLCELFEVQVQDVLEYVPD
jgi:DNA-binding Xre family transcriptional regulator